LKESHTRAITILTGQFYIRGRGGGALTNRCARDLMRVKTTAQSEKILSAAARLFGSQRYDQVRMDDIAAEAEVGKGTLYRYFSDKEELFLALLTRCSEQFLQRVESVVAGGGSPRERLESVVATVIDEFDSNPHLLNLLMRADVMAEEGRTYPWQAARQEMPELVVGLFREAEKREEFRVRDPELMALVLLGGIRAVIRFGEKPRPKDLSRRIVDGFLLGGEAPCNVSASPLTRVSAIARRS
jgi:TetR/AcrR family fatty acid metabolism transcriptional regulator